MANKKTPTADTVIQDFDLLSFSEKLEVVESVNLSIKGLKAVAENQLAAINDTQKKINGGQ